MPPLNQAYVYKKPTGASLGRYAPVVGLTVLVTLAISNLFKTAPPEQRQGGQGEFIPSRQALEVGEADYRQSPRWQIPDEWRRKVSSVCAGLLQLRGLAHHLRTHPEGGSARTSCCWPLS